MAVDFRGSWVSPCCMIPWGEVWHWGEIFTKNLINLAKSNQSWKYFNLLVSGPGRFEWWKKFGRKSRWNVPLNRIRKSGMTPPIMQGDWLCAVWYRYRYCGEIPKNWNNSGNLHRSLSLRLYTFLTLFSKKNLITCCTANNNKISLKFSQWLVRCISFLVKTS